MPITRTRSVGGTVSTGSSLTITLPSAPSSGQVGVIQIGVNSGTGSRVSSITQTNVTWTKQVESYYAGQLGMETWVGVVSASAGTGITITLASSLTAVAHYSEYSGVNTSSPVVATGSSIDDTGFGGGF
jgi:hypothetical protein